MSVSDRIHTSLVSYGGSTIDERVYNYLGSLGLTGTISDRLAKYSHNGKKGWQAIIEGFGLSLSAGFVRQELFGESQQGVLYVSQPSYLGQQVLYQDAAGTTPVVDDGDPVGLMLDLSPNGHNASQSTSAARPLYRTDGVLHWLEFDGVDDYLEVGSLSFSGAFTIAVSARVNSSDGENPRLASKWSGNNRNGDWILSPTGIIGSDMNSRFLVRKGDSNTQITQVATVGGDHVHMGELDAELSIYLDGEVSSSGNVSQPLPEASTSIQLGWDEAQAASSRLSGREYGVVMVGASLSDDRRGRLNSYLASLAGITL